MSARGRPQGSPRANADLIAAAQRLYAEEHREEIVRLVGASSNHPAQLDYYRGMALARLERWEEAKRAFETGQKKDPFDKRFPLELAGIAFKRKNFPEARTNLKRALRLGPRDTYANDFLGTLYFLEGNLEAALKYWNRIRKPEIEEIRTDPQPRTDPVLLDRGFAFSPASTLTLADLLTTQARLEHLGIFPRYHLELSPRQDEKFDAVFHATERNGWGESREEALLSLFRGVPFQTIHPEFFNIRHSAMNFISLLRWDSQKRRVFASLRAPLGRNPKWRYELYLDGRKENWDISKTFHGRSPPAGDLRMEKLEAGAAIQCVRSSRWSWRSSIVLRDRRFQNFEGSSAAQFFTDGLSLKYRARLDYQVLRIPERRITLDSAVSGQFGRMLSGAFNPFANMEGSLATHYFPHSRGDDYEMTGRFRSGKTFGQIPFDELFMLGLERDNELWLRGHVGTHHGKKGSAPLGRDYLLSNWDLYKKMYENSFLRVRLGPFVDSGRIYDRSRNFGSRRWFWDAGLECHVRILGGPSVVFSYGKDLRSGQNAFYVTVGR